jgi:hypothetical protein
MRTRVIIDDIEISNRVETEIEHQSIWVAMIEMQEYDDQRKAGLTNMASKEAAEDVKYEQIVRIKKASLKVTRGSCCSQCLSPLIEGECSIFFMDSSKKETLVEFPAKVTICIFCEKKICHSA